MSCRRTVLQPHVELEPLDVLEVPRDTRDNLWLRGGFPDSFLAADDAASALWRKSSSRPIWSGTSRNSVLEIPAETLRRFWTMLAHTQGQLLNAAQPARPLAVDGKTIARYLDLMVDLLLVCCLQPYRGNVRKHLVKSPKIHVRDSGLVHTLLRLDNREAVLGHTVAGGSWEGFLIENILRAAPERTLATFHRTPAGAEIDLVLEMPNRKLWAIEVKRGLAPKLERGFHHAPENLNPDRCFVVYSGDERYSRAEGVEVIGLEEICRTVCL